MHKNIADFLVIGGGIFGLYTALYLSKHNNKICVLEKENQFMKKIQKI